MSKFDIFTCRVFEHLPLLHFASLYLELGGIQDLAATEFSPTFNCMSTRKELHTSPSVLRRSPAGSTNCFWSSSDSVSKAAVHKYSGALLPSSDLRLQCDVPVLPSQIIILPKVSKYQSGNCLRSAIGVVAFRTLCLRCTKD